MQDINCESYAEMVKKLSSFISHFKDFRNHKFDFQLLACLFDLLPENALDCFQLE